MARKRSSLPENPPAASGEGEEDEIQPQEPVVSGSEEEASPEDFVVKQREDKPQRSSSREKRAKKNSPEKKLFRRVWSEDNEIVILDALAEHKAKNGSSSLPDMDAFYATIKKSLPMMEFSKSQLSEKVKSLKKRYRNCMKKKTYQPSNPIEKEAFDLLTKIWSQNVAGEDPNSNGATVRKSSRSLKPTPEPMEQVGAEADCCDLVSDLAARLANSLPESVLKRGLELVSGDKKANLVVRWREVKAAELKFYAKKTRVMSEQLELIHEALRSSSSGGQV